MSASPVQAPMVEPAGAVASPALVTPKIRREKETFKASSQKACAK